MNFALISFAALSTSFMIPKGLRILEHSLLFRPHKLEQDFQFNLQYNMQELNITTNINNNINLIYAKNTNSKNFIIYAHGNGGSLQSRIPIIELLSRYSSVVAFDYRGYGKSTGQVCEKGFYKDIYYVWKYVIQELHINPNDITLYGHSLGSSIISHLGEKLSKYDKYKPHSLILEAGFCDMNSLVKDITRSNFITSLLKSKFDTQNYLKNISNIKILVAHSPDDELIPIYHQHNLMKINKNIQDFTLKGRHCTTVFDDAYLIQIKGMLKYI
jgi:alpha/beta superfamily hydrolase